jgi:hypothetical protein
MSNHKTAFVILGIAAALALVMTASLVPAALANVKGSTDTGCTNGGGQSVSDKTSCPSSPPQTQDTCNANTGNGKCPKGQN